ncbi:MAG: hypothetical protein AAF603_09620, partial [Pseudomonadota bacterium]
KTNLANQHPEIVLQLQHLITSFYEDIPENIAYPHKEISKLQMTDDLSNAVAPKHISNAYRIQAILLKSGLYVMIILIIFVGGISFIFYKRRSLKK